MSGEVDKWSVEQCRDWLAEKAGWVYVATARSWTKTEWGESHIRDMIAGVLPGHDHPIPATLDAAASAMPAEYSVQVSQFSDGWYTSAWKRGARTKAIRHDQAENEIVARFRLAVKARMAGGGGETKA